MELIKEAMEALSLAIQNDLEYAWVWHCNVAVPPQDQGLSHEKANKAAANFMHIAFGVRMWEHPNYIQFEKQWQSENGHGKEKSNEAVK